MLPERHALNCDTRMKAYIRHWFDGVTDKENLCFAVIAGFVSRLMLNSAALVVDQCFPVPARRSSMPSMWRRHRDRLPFQTHLLRYLNPKNHRRLQRRPLARHVFCGQSFAHFCSRSCVRPYFCYVVLPVIGHQQRLHQLLRPPRLLRGPRRRVRPLLHRGPRRSVSIFRGRNHIRYMVRWSARYSRAGPTTQMFGRATIRSRHTF